MSNPTLLDAHIDAALSGVTVSYLYDKPSIARRLSGTPVAVDKKTNKYFVWTKADLLANRAKRRAPGTAPQEVNYRLSNDSFECHERALRHALSDELESNADIELRKPIASFLTQQISLAEDVDFFDSTTGFMRTGIWGTDATLGATWNSASGGDPINDIATAKRTIRIATGGNYEPNVMLIADAAADVLINHAAIQGRLGISADRGLVTGSGQRETFLAKFFGFEEVIIADRSYNTAAENATASMSSVLSDGCLIVHRGASAINTPTAFRTFAWSKYDRGASAFVYEDGDKGKGVTYVDCRSYIGMKLVAGDCGYYIADCIT